LILKHVYYIFLINLTSIYYKQNSIETTCLFAGFHAHHIQQVVPRRTTGVLLTFLDMIQLKK